MKTTGTLGEEKERLPGNLLEPRGIHLQAPGSNQSTRKPPKLRGAVGDIRRWVVTSSREGRELKDQDHKSKTQEDTTQRPQAPLEPRGGNNPRNQDLGSLQEATRKENSQDPPAQGTI